MQAMWYILLYNCRMVSVCHHHTEELHLLCGVAGVELLELQRVRFQHDT